MLLTLTLTLALALTLTLALTLDLRDAAGVGSRAALRGGPLEVLPGLAAVLRAARAMLRT